MGKYIRYRENNRRREGVGKEGRDGESRREASAEGRDKGTCPRTGGKVKEMRSQRETLRTGKANSLTQSLVTSPQKISRVARSPFIRENKILSWSPTVMKGLIPVIEGGCKVFHVLEFIDFRQPD